MDGKTIGILAIVSIAVAGGWYVLSGTPAKAPVGAITDQTPAVTNTTTTTATTSTTAATNPTVVYSAGGFSPKSISVAVGTTVTFVNQGGDEMWIASDPHPTHQGYDGTTKNQHCAAGYTGSIPLDQCSAGVSYNFTFTKVGTWGYHNHGSAGDKGTVIVTAK